MFTSDALLDLHERAHRNVQQLLAHCREFSAAEIHRELPGFGGSTIHSQLHHEIGAERYWIGVLQGRMDVDDDAPDYPTIDSLEGMREQVFAGTAAYLRSASQAELNTPRRMMTWGNVEKELAPAQVFLRTQMHLYHHQGQVSAMCRILGKPIGGMDYPIV